MKLPRSFYNWLTALGAVIASISLVLILFMVILTFLTGEEGSYSGLITFIILPVFLVAGLLMIPLGIFIRRRKEKKHKIIREERFPVVDLNDPVHRRILVTFLAITGIIILGTAYGSYEAYHYTESTRFCGQLCHKVMTPEYTTYQQSAHARVACVECHVGTGASWYVKSKMSGLYQVYSVTFNKYPKPIPTPIRNLRPARETCEECHWPQKFYPQKLVVEKHFLPDDENTEWDIALLMKTGPLHEGRGLTEGIHWHINPNVRIEYYASDSIREHIPWVRYTDLSTGEARVFADMGFAGQEPPDDSIRVMDCLDCHNRPSHDFTSPMRFVNAALAAGRLSTDLPDIKSLAMDILNTKMPTTDSAMKYIDSQVQEYYKNSYENIYRDSFALIEKTVQVLQEEFRLHIFPEMNVSWQKYPKHIGHMEFNGCFRCHDNKHITPEKEMIPRDCNLCHSIVAQGAKDTLHAVPVLDQLEFYHPDDPDQTWKEVDCVECHRDLYAM